MARLYILDDDKPFNRAKEVKFLKLKKFERVILFTSLAINLLLTAFILYKVL